MSWQAVEDALMEAAPELAERARSHPRWFTDAVVDRSRRYTSERAELHRPADPRADLAARALFFSVVDAAKPAAPLLELARRIGGASGPLRGERSATRVTDLGAGCGAMSLGLLVTAAAMGWRDPWQVTLVDRDAAALEVARRAIASLARALRLDVSVRVVEADVATGHDLGAADLVLAGTVLNELRPSAARALVQAALSSLPAHGALVLIEPALRQLARALQALRDELVAGQRARILAPCTHERTPCPMLARDTDWCHEARPWQPPAGVRAVAAATGLRDGDLKYSYAVLAPPQAPEVRPLFDVPAEALALRVVSGALPGKGRKEVIACGELGRVPLRRLDRRAGAPTQWFEELVRGDLVAVPRDRVAEGIAAGRVEIGAEDAWSTAPTPRLAPGAANDEDLGPRG